MHSLSGAVVDTMVEMVEIGDILLFEGDSESVLRYTTLIQGKFHFEELNEGNYKLQVSCLGFEPAIQNVFLDKNLELRIVLEEAINALDEVELLGAKNPITYSNGNISVDVTNPIYTASPDPIDLLSQIPNVQISPNRDALSILGRGNPLIYLDNQRVDFEVLTGLSVENLASIDIINNPSAKYEANGRAVLLLKSKRNTKSGAEGNIRETASYKRNYNNYLSSNVNLNLGKLELRGNMALNNLGAWESNTFRFSIPEANIFSDYLVVIPKNQRTQKNFGLGAYFPLKDGSYVSLNSVAKLQTDKFPIKTNSFLEVPEGSSTIITDTGNNNTKNYVSTNFNYERKLGKQIGLFTGIQHSFFETTLQTSIANGNLGDEVMLEQIRDQRYTLNTLALRIDLEQLLHNGIQWDLGASWNDTRASAFSLFEQVSETDQSVFDFDYVERLYAGYSNFSLKVNKKIGLTAGLRTEYNEVKSGLGEFASPLVERKKMRLFPKLGANTNFSKDLALSGNYAKSINRPNFSRTSTISAYINPVLEGSGNINLQPSITDEVTVNLQWKDKSFRMGYYDTTQPFTFTISYDDQQEVAILSQTNLDREQGWYITAIAPFTKGNWVSNTVVSFNYNNITDSGTSGKASPYLYVYNNHQFILPKDTTVAVGARAITKRREGIFQRNAQIIADATVSKKFGDSLLCTLRFNDIFRQMNFVESYNLRGVLAKGQYFGDAREIAIAMRYNLGQKRDRKFKNKDVDENLQRIN